VALIAAALSLTMALTSCEVTQIDWRNHYYVVSGQSCVDYGALTVRNGTGLTDPFAPLNNGRELEPLRVDVVKTVYGDMTGDGINDVAVLLRCSYSATPRIPAQTGYEIQVFTRNGVPVARIWPPEHLGFGNRAPRFNPADFFYQTKGPEAGHLITGVSYYDDPSDPQCCPSGYEQEVWYWLPHSQISKGTDGFVSLIQTING
jgi:hypothetical protein